eukprot:6207410-Pyramimonas_sp.AAC.1
MPRGGGRKQARPCDALRTCANCPKGRCHHGRRAPQPSRIAPKAGQLNSSRAMVYQTPPVGPPHERLSRGRAPLRLWR